MSRQKELTWKIFSRKKWLWTQEPLCLRDDMKKPTLIGLIGAKRSGKDSTFQILHQIGIPCERVAWADALKMELAVMLNITPSWIDEHKELYRPALQWLGQYRRDTEGEDYWIKRAEERIEELARQGVGVVVITDCRYPNESKYVQEHDGILWRIHRSYGLLEDIRMRLLKPEHSSEAFFRLLPADYEIYNRGSLEDLRGEVEHAAKLFNLLPKPTLDPANCI